MVQHTSTIIIYSIMFSRQKNWFLTPQLTCINLGIASWFIVSSFITVEGNFWSVFSIIVVLIWVLLQLARLTKKQSVQRSLFGLHFDFWIFAVAEKNMQLTKQIAETIWVIVADLVDDWEGCHDHQCSRGCLCCQCRPTLEHPCYRVKKKQV